MRTLMIMMVLQVLVVGWRVGRFNVCMYVCNKTIYIAAYVTSHFEAALQS